MRLVIKYSVGDGCTFSCTVTTPVIYESAEAFAVEFEEACKANRGKYQMRFAHLDFEPANFLCNDEYFGPDIMTVDEWFSLAEK